MHRFVQMTSRDIPLGKTENTRVSSLRDRLAEPSAIATLTIKKMRIVNEEYAQTSHFTRIA